MFKKSKEVIYEDLQDAILFMINGSSKGIKEINNQVFSPERLLKKVSCEVKKLEPHFTFSEMMDLMKYCERYDPLYFLCDQLGFERPVKKQLELENPDEIEMLIRTA